MMLLLLLAMIITQILPLITANTIFIPRIVIQAGYPRGFRAYVPDFPGMQYFAFQGQLNPINGPRRVLRGIIRTPVNGYWIYQDDDCVLRTNDAVSYSTHMIINRVSYKSPPVTWRCPEPSQFVDFKAPLPPPKPTPPALNPPTPGDGNENPDFRGAFLPPPPDVKSETPASETSTQSTASEQPGTSPSSQNDQTTPSTNPSSTSSTPSVTTESTVTSTQSTTTKQTSPSSTQSIPITDATTPSSTVTTPSKESTPSSTLTTPTTETSSTSVQSTPSSTLTTPTTETSSTSVQSTPSTLTTPSNQTATSPEESETPKDESTTPQNAKTSEPTSESTDLTKESTPGTTTSEKLMETSSTPSDSTTPSSETTYAETSPTSTTSMSPVLDRRSDDPTDATPTDGQLPTKPENNSESTTPSMYIPVSEQPEEPSNENQPLFPGPFKPMMPPKGPSFEICSNPWNFVPRENETKTQKLEKQVAKLQCDLALFQRKFMQLGQVLEGELTDIKNLNTGVASRMSRIEKALKTASDA